MTEKTYSQIYYEKNKERLLKYVKEKTMCECGTVIARINKSKHMRTKKHENRMRDKQIVKE